MNSKNICKIFPLTLKDPEYIFNELQILMWIFSDLRSFAYAEEDVELVSIVDDFLKKNIDSIALTNEFEELPRLQVIYVSLSNTLTLSHHVIQG